MKRVLNKILIIFIISIFLFEFVFSNSYISYAQDGEFAVGNKVVNFITNLGGGIISILLWLPKLKATAILVAVDAICNQATRLVAGDGPNGTSYLFLTPYDIFFTKYQLLDVNFFSFENVSEGSLVYEIRTQISGWYYALRTISVVILLAVLVYVGIRMALASVADERAKYKKMIFDWTVSLALVFLMHYFAIFLIYLNEALVNALDTAFSDFDTEGAILGLALEALIGIGLRSIIAFLVYVGILAQVIFFFVAYFNRMLKMGFLILISPLITLTYSIDRMGDGKAQAFGNWVKEFLFTLLIQPFHCIIYMAFIKVAFELVGFKIDFNYLNNFLEVNQLAQGFLAILCIKFIADGEKIVKKIFGFSNDDKKTSFAGGAAATIIVVKNTAKIADKAGKAINNTALDISKLKNTFGQGKEGGVADKLGKITDKLPAGIKDKVKDGIGSKLPGGKGAGGKGGLPGSSKPTRTIEGRKTKKGKSKAHGKIRDFVRKRSSKLAVAAIAGIAAYSSGSTDALTAIGIGSEVGKAAESLHGLRGGPLIKEDSRYNYDQDKKQKNELDRNVDKLQESLKGTTESLERLEESTEEFCKEVMTEEEIEQVEETIKQENEANEAVKQAEAELKKEVDPAKKQALEERIASEKKKAEEAAAAREELAKKNAEAKKERIDELRKQKASQEKALEKALEEQEHFWDEENIYQRAYQRGAKNPAKKMEDKVSEIEKEIRTLIVKRRGIQASDLPDEDTPEIRPEDRLAHSMTKLVLSKAQQSNLEDKTVDPSGIASGLGFSEEESAHLQTLISQYGDLLNQSTMYNNTQQSENYGMLDSDYISKIVNGTARMAAADSED